MGKENIEKALEKFKHDENFQTPLLRTYYIYGQRNPIFKELFGLTGKDIRAIVIKLNLSRGQTYYYNDGVREYRISEKLDSKDVPENFIKGRLSSSTRNFSTYNKNIFITNGSETQRIKKDSKIPEGWWRGSSYKSTAGMKSYTDGKTNMMLKPDDPVPDGFVLGMTKKVNPAIKFRKKVYNNGKVQIKLRADEEIPPGFVEGKLTREIKIAQRDKEMQEKGFVPLKEISKKYGKSGYMYYKQRGELNLIELPEPYTYVSIEDLPKLVEYSKVNHSYGTSIMEQDIYSFCQFIFPGEVRRNVKSIIRDDDGYYELDIYIPEKNLAIEFNGNYWHSIEVLKDKNYHLKKTNLCKEKGIRLIHIFEYEWVTKPGICKSLISSALGVFSNKFNAEDCEVKEIKNKEKVDEFLENNHIQGATHFSYTLGLFHKGELVQILVFKQNKENVELVRECSKLNTQVAGGLTKLLSWQPFSSFVFYADAAKMDIEPLFNLGFSFLNSTAPTYKCISRESETLNEVIVQSNETPRCFKDRHCSEKTNAKNIEDTEFVQIYDCGNLKLEFKKCN